MSEPKYPRAFVAYDEWNRRYGAIRYREWEAQSDCGKADKCVELIPLPEHEAIVAAAVAAERERLMKMVTPLTVLQDVIREVPS